MSWQDTMRLRRRADWLRGAAWVNALISSAAAVAIHDVQWWLAVATWLCGASAFLIGVAHLVDKRASRVVGR